MSTQFLSEDNRAKVRLYLGYPGLAQRQTLTAGVPFTTPTGLLLEEAMRQILDLPTLELLNELIEDIDCSRQQIKAAKKRLKVSKVAYEIEMNQRELDKLWLEDYRLCRQLADQLACPIIRHATGRSDVYTSNMTIPIVGA